MASDCIQKWISAKMITANQDRNIKVGTENKFPFENGFFANSSFAITYKMASVTAFRNGLVQK